MKKAPKCYLRGFDGAVEWVPERPLHPACRGSIPLRSTYIITGSTVAGMNKLTPEIQERVISALVEGSSIRSVERMTGVHRDTIMRLGVRVGTKCGAAMDAMMYGLDCKRLELDEIWAYVGKKQRHVTYSDNPANVGDFWTWVALDSETKLLPTYAVGKRDAATAHDFVTDLASRLNNRVQISSDGLRLYIESVEVGFGGDVDHAQIVKSYEAEPIGPGRYSPPKVLSADKSPIVGNPVFDRISTAFVERQNLTMRMSMRRFTRLTNAFSKKLENLKAAVSLHFCYHNLVRRHATIGTTPAVAAGVTDRACSVFDLIDLANETD